MEIESESLLPFWSAALTIKEISEEDRCVVCHRTVMLLCRFLCMRTAFDDIFSHTKNCEDMLHNPYPFYVKTSWKHVQMLRMVLWWGHQVFSADISSCEFGLRRLHRPKIAQKSSMLDWMKQSPTLDFHLKRTRLEKLIRKVREPASPAGKFKKT